MINLWLVVRDDAKQAINVALNTPEEDYQGPVPNKARKIFESMACRGQVQKMFKSPDIGGNVYHLYSLYIDAVDSQDAIDAVNYLTAEYPDHIIVGGAWRWNGVQIPYYTPHPQLIKMMPNGILEDVNLMAGQSPRDFS